MHAGSAAQLVSIQAELSERSQEIRGLEATHGRRLGCPVRSSLACLDNTLARSHMAHRRGTARRCGYVSISSYVTPTKAALDAHERLEVEMSPGQPKRHPAQIKRLRLLVIVCLSALRVLPAISADDFKIGN